MITIQPFAYTDDQYEAIVAIDAAVFDDHATSIEEWKYDDHALPKEYPFQRDLVYKDGVLVAFSEYRQTPWAYHPRKYDWRIWVHPDHEFPDIRPAHWAHLIDTLAEKDLIAITSGMVEDKPFAMQFFADFGFVEVAREAISTLDVAAIDPMQLTPLITRVKASGIVIQTLEELATNDPDWQHTLYDLDVTISRDIPSLGEKRALSFDEWIPFRLEGPTFDPKGWFIALDGERYVGLSQGSVNPAHEGEFVNGVTGVRREYRRRGIASALKAHLILYARQRGVQEIFTTNDSKNPMYALNLQLGFHPEPAWVRFEKRLDR